MLKMFVWKKLTKFLNAIRGNACQLGLKTLPSDILFKILSVALPLSGFFVLTATVIPIDWLTILKACLRNKSEAFLVRSKKFCNIYLSLIGRKLICCKSNLLLTFAFRIRTDVMYLNQITFVIQITPWETGQRWRMIVSAFCRFLNFLFFCYC